MAFGLVSCLTSLPWACCSARQKFAQNALPQAVPRVHLTEIYFRLSLTLDRRDRSGQEATVFSSVQEVDGGLRRAGYIADPVATTTVFLAASLHRPVFTEGPAGSGKTQLAYAVAHPVIPLWSACSAMKESARTRPLGSLMNRCKGFAWS